MTHNDWLLETLTLIGAYAVRISGTTSQNDLKETAHLLARLEAVATNELRKKQAAHQQHLY